MIDIDLEYWESRLEKFVVETSDSDAAHDLGHIRRVVGNAKLLNANLNATPEILIPAAWLHDCVTIRKDSKHRAEASTLAADRAVRYLESRDYPEHFLGDIEEAIRAHSYSGGVEPETIEARIVQDADRLDALGAIGIARCFTVGGKIGRQLYHLDEPFPDERPVDDESYTLDHFYEKLLQLPATMKTDAGRREAKRRVEFMEQYLDQLDSELSFTYPEVE